jgi:hypothetical protein
VAEQEAYRGLGIGTWEVSFSANEVLGRERDRDGKDWERHETDARRCVDIWEQ